MKDSLIFPGFDPDDNKDNDVDLQIDFTQFLEEAKRFANENKLHPIAKEQNGKKEVVNQEKKGMKNKKSWKSAFFSFWRSSSEKKAKQHPRDTSRSSYNSTNTKQRHCFSGPVYDMEAASTSGRKWRRAPVSGPITGVFHQKNETPYVSLDKFKEGQHDVKTYGPVYLVS